MVSPPRPSATLLPTFEGLGGCSHVESREKDSAHKIMVHSIYSNFTYLFLSWTGTVRFYLWEVKDIVVFFAACFSLRPIL